MLAAIDAYFSASDGTEAEVAENLLLDVRDEINKQKYVPETNFGNMAEPKIGCVNHDCDKCKAVQEPWGYLEIDDIESQREYPHNCRNVNLWHEGGEGMTAIYIAPPAAQPAPVQEPAESPDDWSDWKVTPPAPQPVPVKTYHDGKPWPVAPKPWVGLTDKEVGAAYDFANANSQYGHHHFGFWLDSYRAIEAKLKEKNT
jgi:hypothetical protein